jgi:transposase-like protein
MNCPHCDTAARGEWDPVLKHYVCPTCSRTWTVEQKAECPPLR